ncbi:GNAT family N-acetyltransferase [Cellulosilyticum sp. I15G10I2]|uniref:GNAT family N-acetyltransferase n=1 Tax=Cellulosilyticum sp. I15G10I2 TaxID=1892843 RepID=UPI00085C5534|nr:GNAT family N-acetyltransferase [Cellulosilyticum sp. I15G10I2]
MERNIVTIKPMLNYSQDVRLEAASVFADAYYRDLSFLSKDRNKLKEAFKKAFCHEVFYLAEIQGEIVGMLACANRKQRGMVIDKASFKKSLGFIKGSLAYWWLKREFNAPLSYSDDTAYIECVATKEKARGKGVSTALFQYVMQELPYRRYVLEVIDSNQNAYRLYKKLGFNDFKRKREKYSKIKGFKERIYMEWQK